MAASVAAVAMAQRRPRRSWGSRGSRAPVQCTQAHSTLDARWCENAQRRGGEASRAAAAARAAAARQRDEQQSSSHPAFSVGSAAAAALRAGRTLRQSFGSARRVRCSRWRARSTSAARRFINLQPGASPSRLRSSELSRCRWLGRVQVGGAAGERRGRRWRPFSSPVVCGSFVRTYSNLFSLQLSLHWLTSFWHPNEWLTSLHCIILQPLNT